MTSSARALPHWDMTVVYPSLSDPEFEQSLRSTIGSIAELVQLFDDKQIAYREPAALTPTDVEAFETVVERYNEVLAETRTLFSYISSFVSTDSRNNLAQAKMSELQQHLMRLNQLETRFNAWVGSLDIAALIQRSALAEAHAFPLQQAQQLATHQMTPAEEDLSAELNLTSGTAWGRLHSNITSQLLVPFEQDGTTQELSMSMIRAMAFEPDRELRRRAYETELAAWEKVAVPLAAALNSIKGEVNTLAYRRGWSSPLAASLQNNNIDQQTLDAMMDAARASFPDFRRYLRTKAHALGSQTLGWYDLFAPVGTSGKVWEYDTATEFIVEQFGQYSSKMSDFAARAFREQWVDAEPRPGKRDGAFCMWLRGDESRVFSNFKPSFNSVSTLAHELGHAYHNLNLADRTMLQRAIPMTLAETASIFCETIIRQAALQRADTQEQIAILEAALQGSCQIVVDISSRFLFEQRVFERRRQRELSVDELKQIMLEAQQETYGDGLDQTALHPFMWAVKGHYYSSARSFYNYPYMFGLLFGLGLYARYQQDPEAFKAGYDDLLSATGLADAATLAARFGIDLHTTEFWQSSLNIIRGNIDRFEQLIAPGLAWGGPSDDGH